MHRLAALSPPIVVSPERILAAPLRHRWNESNIRCEQMGYIARLGRTHGQSLRARLKTRTPKDFATFRRLMCQSQPWTEHLGQASIHGSRINRGIRLHTVVSANLLAVCACHDYLQANVQRKTWSSRQNEGKRHAAGYRIGGEIKGESPFLGLLRPGMATTSSDPLVKFLLACRTEENAAHRTA